MAGLTPQLATAYSRGVDAWASGATLTYGPLAQELVATSPHALSGRRVLDTGAGTGVGSTALRAVGASGRWIQLYAGHVEGREAPDQRCCCGEQSALKHRAPIALATQFQMMNESGSVIGRFTPR